MKQELIDWLRSRPAPVQELLKMFPPGCKVRAREGVSLITPAPGKAGRVVSWTEDGSVSVVVPGDDTRGFCDPDWLEVVEFEEGMTSKDVAEALGGSN